jgi:CHAD domain-containing protein
MLIELKSRQESLRKLRKSLKKLPKDPSQEDVHRLRTQSRRMEATLYALHSSKDKAAAHLLKAIEPIRKAAGSVRDMDVLTAKALTLPGHRDEALARLVEQLGGKRMEYARELFDEVADQRKAARRGLKRQLKWIEDDFSHDESPEKVLTIAVRLKQELARGHMLTERNLHRFRIQAKQLRYILQLTDDLDPQLVKRLGRVTSKIGDWHDWRRLSKLSGKILKDNADGVVVKEIKAIEQKALRQALAEANRLRASLP